MEELPSDGFGAVAARPPICGRIGESKEMIKEEGQKDSGRQKKVADQAVGMSCPVPSR